MLCIIENATLVESLELGFEEMQEARKIVPGLGIMDGFGSEHPYNKVDMLRIHVVSNLVPLIGFIHHRVTTLYSTRQLML